MRIKHFLSFFTQFTHAFLHSAIAHSTSRDDFDQARPFTKWSQSDSGTEFFWRAIPVSILILTISFNLANQSAVAQSEVTQLLKPSPISTTESDEGLQIEWTMPEAAQESPDEFNFSEWVWDNYSGYYIPFATVVVEVADAQSTQDLPIEIIVIEDAAWQNEILLAEVEVMYSPDGEELPNMQPVDLQLPTEPIFVLRKGSQRGSHFVVVGVSPIYEAEDGPRVITKIVATISEAKISGETSGRRVESAGQDSESITENEPQTKLISPLATPAATSSNASVNAVESKPTTTVGNESPLLIPVATDVGLISPLSTPRVLLIETATVKATRTPSKTPTKKPTATKKATRTPTATKKATATKKPTVQSTRTPTRAPSKTPKATQKATQTSAPTIITATLTTTATQLADIISPLPDSSNETTDTGIELVVATQEPTQATPTLAIISLLNTPEPVSSQVALAVATTIAPTIIAPTTLPNATVSMTSTTTSFTTPNTDSSTISSTESLGEISTETVAQAEQTEQIWTRPRYISRTWLVLPIFLTFLGSILLVLIRKPS